MKSVRGFTLIEMIVVLGVIFVLVGILLPTVLKYISDAQSNRAEADVRRINAAVNDLIRDTGRFPGNLVTGGTAFLVTPGSLAGNSASISPWATSGDSDPLEDHLLRNDPNGDTTEGGSGDYPGSGRNRWKGPYLQAQGLTEDPWGNAYQINVDTLVGSNTSPTWVMSAGPDSTFQTATSATSLSGDDVGVRIK